MTVNNGAKMKSESPLGFWKIFEENPDACLAGPHGTSRGIVFATKAQAEEYARTLTNGAYCRVTEWNTPTFVNLAKNAYLQPKDCRLCDTLAYLWEDARTRLENVVNALVWAELREVLRKARSVQIAPPCPVCGSERLADTKDGQIVIHEPTCMFEDLARFWERHLTLGG